MGTENKSKSRNTNKDNNNNKRKHRYLPHNKPVKKGGYPLRPGVQGFFITCDGGREHQASQEAINVIDSFYEELVHGKRDLDENRAELPNKPTNKKIKFTYSESDSDDDDDNDDQNAEGGKVESVNEEEKVQSVDEGDKVQSVSDTVSDKNHESLEKENLDSHKEAVLCDETQKENKDDKSHENQDVEAEEPPTKKQCVETEVPKSEKVICKKMEEKSIDHLIEDELAELKDKSKRLFNKLDSGCNGVVFVQMRKRDEDPSPSAIVKHMMTSIAATKKHMSRFILRVLPTEVSCYASEEEISRAIKPLIEQYFPVETETPLKFAVLYDARANTGVDRMKIINTVAKCVPGPHKVDLNNPDRNIVVQVVKTVCLIGVVEKYKELAKYNLRQLTSPK